MWARLQSANHQLTSIKVIRIAELIDKNEFLYGCEKDLRHFILIVKYENYKIYNIT